MSGAVYCHLSRLIVIGIAVLSVICLSVAHATESSHGDAVSKGVTDPRNPAAVDNKEHAQMVTQRRPNCEREYLSMFFYLHFCSELTFIHLPDR